MAERQQSSAQTQRAPRPTTETTANPTRPGSALIQRLRERARHSPQLFGLMTLFMSGAILLFLTGLTVTATVMGLVFFGPLILLTSPIWVPIGFFLFILAAGVFALFGSVAAAVAGFSWAYRYFKGMHPPGSNRVDYARSRIYDTASHVRDYAREYGGYLQSKVKDAAPGA